MSAEYRGNSVETMTKTLDSTAHGLNVPKWENYVRFIHGAVTDDSKTVIKFLPHMRILSQ